MLHGGVLGLSSGYAVNSNRIFHGFTRKNTTFFSNCYINSFRPVILCGEFVWYVLWTNVREKECFLTDMLDEKDITGSSNGYMEGERVAVTTGPLKGCKDKIRKVIRRKSLAIMEMTLYERKVETALGLDLS